MVEVQAAVHAGILDEAVRVAAAGQLACRIRQTARETQAAFGERSSGAHRRPVDE